MHTSPTSGATGTDPPAVVELRVEGMHCGSCVALIEETLAEQPGVAGATVDLESASASVAYDPAVTGPDRLCAAVSEAGYSAATAG